MTYEIPEDGVPVFEVGGKEVRRIRSSRWPGLRAVPRFEIGSGDAQCRFSVEDDVLCFRESERLSLPSLRALLGLSRILGLEPEDGVLVRYMSEEPVSFVIPGTRQYSPVRYPIPVRGLPEISRGVPSVEDLRVKFLLENWDPRRPEGLARSEAYRAALSSHVRSVLSGAEGEDGVRDDRGNFSQVFRLDGVSVHVRRRALQWEVDVVLDSRPPEGQGTWRGDSREDLGDAVADAFSLARLVDADHLDDWWVDHAEEARRVGPLSESADLYLALGERPELWPDEQFASVVP